MAQTILSESEKIAIEVLLNIHDYASKTEAVNKTDEFVVPTKKVKKAKKNVFGGRKIGSSEGSINDASPGKLFISDAVRHSRLHEAGYVFENCKTNDAIVELQHRAAENLAELHSDLVKRRKQSMASLRPAAMKWMKRFRGIKIQQNAHESFQVRFRATTSAEWKPFVEDPARSVQIRAYRDSQMFKVQLINDGVNEFATKFLEREESKKKLLFLLSLMPKRSEIRHELIHAYLPNMVRKKKKGAINEYEKPDIAKYFRFHF